MTNEQIEATLALEPRVAAAVIKEHFRAKQTFVIKPRGDVYFFMADPTIILPQEVIERRGPVSGMHDANFALKEFLAQFGERVVADNTWGVVGYNVLSNFLELHVEPGYIERGGRIRKGVNPAVIPQLLVTLMRVKEQLQREVHQLAMAMGTTLWWRHRGWLEDTSRKQDWSPREEE